MKINNENNVTSRLLKFLLGMMTLVFLLTALINGCKKSSPPTQARKPAQPAQRAVAAPQAVPATTEKQKEPIANYVYNRRDRRDPFAPLIANRRRGAVGEGVRVPGTLKSYDISDFTVQGIARKNGVYFALLQSPDKKSFTVYEGLTIGLNEGVIESITKNAVVTREEFIDPFGNSKSRQIILELHKGEE